jgi:hypothetical protein
MAEALEVDDTVPANPTHTYLQHTSAIIHFKTTHICAHVFCLLPTNIFKIDRGTPVTIH